MCLPDVQVSDEHLRHRRRRSLTNDPKKERALEPLGSLSFRACLGNGARGLQRRWRCVELPSSRSRPFACVSLERGRHSWHLRPAPISLFCCGSLERTRSYSEGTAVWPGWSRREPRRGRQGILLLFG